MNSLEPGSMPHESGEHVSQLLPRSQRFKYDAFLSYNHRDMHVVKKIQEFLEDYALPTSVDTPMKQIKIYRDETDIRAGHLADQLNGALLESACLLVCVSPAALQSRYVNDEVAAFRDARPEAIFPILLQGGPADVSALLGFESRYADLTQQRPGSTRFKAREQLELVRVLAQVAGRDVRTLVPWHEERRRRRRMTAVATGLAVTLLLAGTGAGYFLQRQAAQVSAADARVQQAKASQETERAHREAQQRSEAVARKQGDGALASLSSNFFAQAAVGLARLDASAALLDGGRYAQATRFLLPRLMTFSEAAAPLAKGQVVRWGESNLLRGPDGELREIPGAVQERVWFSPQGAELVAVDVAHRVSRIAWPAMTLRGPHALGAVRVDSVAWGPNGRVSLRATEIWLASDEDTEDAQVDGDLVRIDLNDDASPLPAVKISADSAANVPSAGALRRLATKRTPARLEFPQLRDERSFWRNVEPALTDNRRTIKPMAVRNFPPYQAIDMKTLKDVDAARRYFLERSMNTDSLESGVVVVDGHHIALASTITGNQWAAYIACEFDPAVRAAKWCHVEDVTATVRRYLSPDNRFMLLTMTEVQEDAFRLLDLPVGGARCKVPAHPAERALHAVFDPSGARLAVLTRDREIWVYDVRKQPCEATVAARFVLPNTRESGGVIAFAGPDTLIWLTEGRYAHAFDVASGLARWTQEVGVPSRVQGTRSISVSPDGRLFATVIGGMIELRSALTGVELSGIFSVFKTAAGVDASGIVCEVAVDNGGAVRVEFDRELLCSVEVASELRKGRGAWVRLVPDDPALGFEAVTELWRRTGISDDDGRSPVTLSKLLEPSPVADR